MQPSSMRAAGGRRAQGDYDEEEALALALQVRARRPCE
jgi:hypothetical protein